MNTSHVSNYSWARPVGLTAIHTQENVRKLVLEYMSGHLGRACHTEHRREWGALCPGPGRPGPGGNILSTSSACGGRPLSGHHLGGLPTVGRGLPAVGCPPWAVGCPQWAARSSLQWAAHRGLPAVGCPPWVMGCPPWAVGCPPWAMGCPPWAVGCPK